MITTMKNITLTAVTVFCLIFGLQSISHSDPQSERQSLYLQRHVDKVKIEKPEEYQDMVDKVGTIVNCLSCHEEEFRKENPG